MIKLKSLTTPLAGICLLAVFFFSSCTSIQQTKVPVEPFSLFSKDADVYISVPVHTNTILLKSIFNKALISDDTEKAEKSIKKFFDHTTRICLAYKISDSFSTAQTLNSTFFNFENNSIQVALEGNFPSLTPFFVFTKKNGFFKKKFYSDTGVVYKYWQNDDNKLEVAFPNSSLILATSDSIIPIQKQLLQAQILNQEQSNIFSNDNDYNFLNNSNDITMYLTSPGKLIPQLLGVSNIELAIDNAKIFLTPDEQNSLYTITMILNMDSQRSQSLFILFMGLTGNNQKYTIEKINETGIRISDIKISVETIEAFLD